MSARANRKSSNPGRKRRLIGYAFIAFGMIVLTVWFASRWWLLEARNRGGELHIEAGILDLQRYKLEYEVPRAEVDIYPLWSTPRWLFRFRREEFAFWYWRADYDGQFRQAYPEQHAWNVGVAASRFQFFSAYASRQTTRIMLLPVAALPLAMGAGLAWSGYAARRRRTTGKCPTCGYNLTGLASSTTCPECGNAEVQSTKSHG